MEYYLTVHARRRLKERLISMAMVERALRDPTKVLYDNNGRIMLKKLFTRKGRARLLMIVGERVGRRLKVITAIETSKIKKYL